MKFHSKSLNWKSLKFESIYDGDVVYCTIGHGDKGTQIKSIDSYVENLNNFQREKCLIKFYKPDRGYGFAFISTTSH